MLFKHLAGGDKFITPSNLTTNTMTEAVFIKLKNPIKNVRYTVTAMRERDGFLKVIDDNTETIALS